MAVVVVAISGKNYFTPLHNINQQYNKSMTITLQNITFPRQTASITAKEINN